MHPIPKIQPLLFKLCKLNFYDKCNLNIEHFFLNKKTMNFFNGKCVWIIESCVPLLSKDIFRKEEKLLNCFVSFLEERRREDTQQQRA